jgi:hypothetical protein
VLQYNACVDQVAQYTTAKMFGEKLIFIQLVSEFRMFIEREDLLSVQNRKSLDETSVSSVLFPLSPTFVLSFHLCPCLSSGLFL